MKHNLKRLLSFVLALAMCMSMVWVPAFAAEVGTTDPDVRGTVQTKTGLGDGINNAMAIGIGRTTGSVTLCKGQRTENFTVTGADFSKTEYDSTKVGFTTQTVVVNFGIVTVKNDAAPGSSVVTFYNSSKWSSTTLNVTIRDHSFTKYTYNNDASCIEDGTKTASCDNGCGAKKTIVAEGTALGHNYTVPVKTVDPTCVSAGYTTYKCKRCDETQNRDETYDPNAHSWGEYTTVEAPTCTEAGLEGRTCTVCGVADENQVISALGHEWGEYVPADAKTCVKNATEIAQCVRNCGAADTREIPDTATGVHEYGEWEEYIAPTDDANGEARAYCIYGCGKFESKVIKPNTHVHSRSEKSEEVITVAPTCLTEGEKKVFTHCADEDCPFVFEDTVELDKDPNAHDGEIEDTYENIDLEKGTYTAVHTYSRCRHFTTETVNMNLEPNVDIDKVLKPTLDNDNKIVNQTAHAGQNVNFSLETSWLADKANIQYKITYDPELVELTLNGATVPKDSTQDFKYNRETKYVLKVKDTMEEQVTDVTYSFTFWFFGTQDISTTVHLTITPHEATENIVNVHEPTCTEPGKKTTDVFCRKCGTLLNSELKETLTDPLGHILGTPKWTWVLTENAKEWDVSAKLHCGRMNCNHSEELSGVRVATSTSGGYKTYTATVTGKDGTTVYTCSKTEEQTCSYTYKNKTVKCFYGQSVTLDAGKKSNWFVNGTLVAAGTSTYTFRVSRENEVITSEPSEEEDAVTALTTVKRISNADGTYTAKFTTDWYVPADKKVKEVKTYYRMTNTNQTQATLVAKNQYVTSKLTSNVGTFVANVPIKPDYGTKYDVWAVSCVILEDNTHIWSKVVCNERAK